MSRYQRVLKNMAMETKSAEETIRSLKETIEHHEYVASMIYQNLQSSAKPLSCAIPAPSPLQHNLRRHQCSPPPSALLTCHAHSFESTVVEQAEHHATEFVTRESANYDSHDFNYLDKPMDPEVEILLQRFDKM